MGYARHVLLLLVVTAVSSGCSLALGGFTALDEARARHEARIELEALDDVETGTPIRVMVHDGTIFKGAFAGSTRGGESSLVLISAEADTLAFPRHAIVQVDRQRSVHSIWPAFAFGAAIDVGFAVLILTSDIGPGLGTNFGAW